MVKYFICVLISTFSGLSISAQYLRISQNEYLNYYHLPTHTYLLKDTLYQYGLDFQEDIAIVAKRKKMGAIDTLGKEIIPLIYDNITSFNKGQAVFTKNNLKGIVNNAGKEIISAKYDYIGDLLYAKRMVMSDGKWGCIDENGAVVVPFVYEYIGNFREGRAMVLSNEKWGFLNILGKIQVKPIYDWVANMHEGKAAVMQNGQYGYVDSTGNELIPLQYDLAWDFSEGLAAVKIDNKIAFINDKAKLIIPAKYEDFFNFSEKVAAVKLLATHKWGFLRKDGTQLTDFIYDEAKQMKNNRAAVKKNEKWGYIDENGTEVIGFQYDEAFNFEQEYAIVGIGETKNVFMEREKPDDLDLSALALGNYHEHYTKTYPLAYINKAGEMLLSPDYQYIKPVLEDYIWTSKDYSEGKYIRLSDKKEIVSHGLQVKDGEIYKDYIKDEILGVTVLKDKNGRLITEKRFEQTLAFPEVGYFKSESGQIFDANAKVLFKKNYTNVYPISKDIFEVSDENKENFQIDIFENQLNTDEYNIQECLGDGYYKATSKDYKRTFVVDSTGRKIIEEEFEAVKPFAKTFFLCQKSQKWGIMQRNGTWVIPCKYDEIVAFEDEMAVVRKDSMRGYAFKNEFLPIISLKEMPKNVLACFSENLAPFLKAGKYGFINKTGKIAIPCVYDMVWGFHQGMAKVRKDHKIGYINVKNEIIIPIEYEDLGLFSDGFSIAQKNGKVGFIDAKNNLVVPCIYQDARPFEDGLAIVQSAVNKRWGCVDAKGTVKILFNFEEISKFSEGYARVVLNGKEGIIDKNGVLIKDCIFDKVGKVENERAIVIYKGKYGVIDMNGQLQISPIYTSIERLKGDIFICKTASLSGFYTKEHELIIPIQYLTESNLIRKYYYALQKEGERFVFDKYGRMIQKVDKPFKAFNEQYFSVAEQKTADIKSDSQPLSIYDNKGNLLIPPVYKTIEPVKTSDALFIVQSDSLVKGVINASKKIVLPIVYQDIKPVTKDLFIATGDSLSAVVNIDNEVVLPPIYQNIEAIKGNPNLFIVQLQGKRAVIKTDNNIIIPFGKHQIYQPYGTQKNYLITQNDENVQDIYTLAGKKLKIPPFTEAYLAEKEDIVLLKNYSKSALYNNIGKEIYPLSEDKIFWTDLNDMFIPIKKGEKWGMIDRKGHIVALFQYDYLACVVHENEVLVIFEQGNKTGIMDAQWNVLYEDTQEIQYDETLKSFYIGAGKNIRYYR